MVHSPRAPLAHTGSTRGTLVSFVWEDYSAVDVWRDGSPIALQHQVVVGNCPIPTWFRQPCAGNEDSKLDEPNLVENYCRSALSKAAKGCCVRDKKAQQ